MLQPGSSTCKGGGSRNGRFVPSCFTLNIFTFRVVWRVHVGLRASVLLHQDSIAREIMRIRRLKGVTRPRGANWATQSHDDLGIEGSDSTRIAMEYQRDVIGSSFARELRAS